MVSRWTLPNRRLWRAASLFVVLALILLPVPRVALARAPVGPELGANPTSGDILDVTPPTADSSAIPNSGPAPLTVQFTDESTGDPSGWAWFLGDAAMDGAWVEMTASAGWSARSHHTSMVMPDGSIVLMGGYDGGRYNDVWRSTDGGATWAEVTPSAEWSARYAHSSVAMPDGSIVLMGGYDGSNKNDVWRSSDGGTTWQVVTANAEWSARYGHTSVVLPDGSIVLMGGYDGSHRNDVWRSSDGGATWTRLTASAEWSASRYHTSVVMPDGSIVLMGGIGGSYKNDVWRSSDAGATWTEVTASAGWSARSHHTSVVTPDGSIVLMGGYDGSRYNDVWRSTDGGATWAEVTANAEWSARHAHTSVVTPDGSIVLIGGMGADNSLHNDVWRLETAGSTPPIAAFSAIPTSGPAPLTVQFADESTGDPTGWAWYFGDEAMDGAWVEMTAEAEWSKRLDHTSVVLPDGSIVLMGGDVTGSGYGSDVWRSTDQGVTWTQMTDDAAWLDRIYHSSVALPDGSIVVMGGYGDDDKARNDVWRSTDQGATWTLMTANAEWGVRWSHTSVALPDGSIVLMGGQYADYLDDVWHSTDQGASWTQMTASAAWPGRRSHASVVLPDGSIVLMGGHDGDSDRNDVWRSTDQGATWSQMTANAGWTARDSLASVALPDGSIVLMGGHDSGFRNDVWRSIDQGATWSLLQGPTSWLPRRSHTAVGLSDGSIVLVGGVASGSGRMNDVWRLETAGSYEQHPSHSYTEPGLYSVTLQAYNAAGYNSVVAGDYITVTIPPPIAAFSAAPTRTQPGLDVEFTDESTGDPTGWAWYFGDEAMDGDWVEMTADAEWSARHSASGVVLPDGSIVLLGGNDGDLKNDVWRSTDQGATWTLMTDDAAWPARRSHTSVALPDGSIVVMGGSDLYANVLMNDVWRSTDQGATWSEMTDDAEWGARFLATSVVLADGSIVVMGGRGDGAVSQNDVWRSTDQGATWTQMTDDAEWEARYSHTSAALPDASIVLMGGYAATAGRSNDVWRSTDQGATWTQMTASAEWSVREYHASVPLPDGSIVVLGGQAAGTGSGKEVWRSRDQGATWSQLAGDVGWPELRYHSAATLPDGSIVIMGGYDGSSRRNDVWRLETAGSYEQHPSHVYAELGTYGVTLQAYNQGGSSQAQRDAYITVGCWIHLPLLMR